MTTESHAHPFHLHIPPTQPTNITSHNNDTQKPTLSGDQRMASPAGRFTAERRWELREANTRAAQQPCSSAPHVR